MNAIIRKYVDEAYGTDHSFCVLTFSTGDVAINLVEGESTLDQHARVLEYMFSKEMDVEVDDETWTLTEAVRNLAEAYADDDWPENHVLQACLTFKGTIEQ